MPLSAFDTTVLAVQVGLLLAIGIQFRGRLQNGEDFILGRRRIDMPFSAATLAMNSVPLWWLLVLIGMAYALGVAAIWLALALFGGVLLGGWFLAPRLRALTNLQQRATFSELLVGDAGEKMRALLVRSMILIISATLLCSCVAQLQLAATFLTNLFDISSNTIIGTAGATIAFALLLSGVWTAVTVDVWQMVVTLFVCVIVAITLSIDVAQAPNFDGVLMRGDWFADQHGLLTVSFTLGIAFVAGDTVGQAPLLTRYMACSSDSELARARAYSLFWAAASLTFALLIGWTVRALSVDAAPSYAVFLATLSHTLSPKLNIALLLAVLGAAIAAIGSGLQCIASHWANDLRRPGTTVSLTRCRVSVALVVIAAVFLASNVSLAPLQKNVDRLLFCWHALGASFGPLLIVRLSGKRVRPGSSLGSMWSGFLLTIVFYLMPDTPGELLERGLPFAAALGIALSGGERRRNPDRADRGERTVHDRLPI